MFSTIYQDNFLAVIDKPAGLICHPVGHYQGYNLTKQIQANWGLHARLMHRLDKNTSGIMLVSLHEKTTQLLYRQFSQRTIQKKYLTLVHGYVQETQQTLNFPIGYAENSLIKIKMAVSEEGLSAQTHYKVIDRNQFCSLLEVSPTTGRKHQIRIHLAAIGHPIINDVLYSHSGLPFLWEYYLDRISPWHAKLNGHGLHAYEITFCHPITQQQLTFQAPPPQDFLNYGALTSLQFGGPSYGRKLESDYSTSRANH